jgi:hypothetical protein
MKLCSLADCERQVHAHELCHFHYIKNKNKTAPECVVENCQNPSRVRGMCTKHYDRQLRIESNMEIDYEDFWEFVKKELRIGEVNERAR